MVFSSMVFLWIFLPVVITLGLIFRKPKQQNILLLIASLLFYAWGEPRYIILLLVSIFMNWGFGVLLGRYPSEKMTVPFLPAKKGKEPVPAAYAGETAHPKAAKQILALSVIANLGLLGFFKYANMFTGTLAKFLPQVKVTNVALPIGISFFTFQAMSYVIDLYRGEYRAQKNPFKIALYISLFPQLIAGPIVRYIDIAAEIDDRSVTRESFALGLRRFIYGLGKKVIISNILARSVDGILGADITMISGLDGWVGIGLYMLQLYYDFSGYSDMAIGLGELFGFHFTENFDYPYMASSYREFWRRWHISLITWFNQYVYFPLGGSRRGTVRTYVNMIIVFLLTGLWHGADWNFVVWGLFNVFFVLLEHAGLLKWMERTKVLKHVYTNVVFALSLVLFYNTDLLVAAKEIWHMLTPWLYTDTLYPLAVWLTPQVVCFAICGILGAGVLKAVFGTKKLAPVAAWWKGSLPEAIYLTGVLAYSILLLAGNTYNPFIYFRF